MKAVIVLPYWILIAQQRAPLILEPVMMQQGKPEGLALRLGSLLFLASLRTLFYPSALYKLLTRPIAFFLNSLSVLLLLLSTPNLLPPRFVVLMMLILCYWLCLYHHPDRQNSLAVSSHLQD
jgi:hypothetical protein